MKKPNFIEIRLPGRKSTLALAKRKYLKNLVGKIVEVNFGRDRERKIFEYLVLESFPRQAWIYGSGKYKTIWVLRLELKVPNEDPEKVL